MAAAYRHSTVNESAQNKQLEYCSRRPHITYILQHKNHCLLVKSAWKWGRRASYSKHASPGSTKAVEECIPLMKTAYEHSASNDLVFLKFSGLKIYLLEVNVSLILFSEPASSYSGISTAWGLPLPAVFAHSRLFARVLLPLPLHWPLPAVST